MSRIEDLQLSRIYKDTKNKLEQNYLFRGVVDAIDKVAGSVRELSNKVLGIDQRVTKIEQNKPKDGYTPVKGIDYEDGADGYTPVKGVDYVDGKDGRDGRDGRDGADGQNGKDGETPEKGVDYFTPEEIQKLVDDTAQIVFQRVQLTQEKIDKQQIIDEVVKKVMEQMPTGTGGGMSENDVKNYVIRYAKGSKVINNAKWGSITGDISKQSDLMTYIGSVDATTMEAHNQLYDHTLIDTALQTETDPEFNAWDKDYNDLTNTPDIPTDTGDLTNGAGFLTAETDPVWESEKATKEDTGVAAGLIEQHEEDFDHDLIGTALQSETDPVWTNEKANYPTLSGNNSFTGTNKFGTAENYIQLSNTGTFKAVGTASWFDDLRVEPTVRGSGTKIPTYTAYKGGIYVYIFDNAIANLEKEVNFKLQLPHGWKNNSAMHLHIHWTPITTGNANDKVRWGLEYTKSAIGGTFGNPLTIYADTPVSPPSTTPTADTHYLTEFADIDLTGMGLSGIIMGRIFRNSSASEDSFAGSVGLLYIDAHIEFDQLGSNSEFIY